MGRNPPISISRPSIGLFPIFILIISGIGIIALIGIIGLCIVHQKKIKTTGKEIWAVFISYEINENAWWVKFIKAAKIPGLKDAIKPGLHVIKRIIWFVFVFACFGFGIVWTIHLSNQIVTNPTTVVFSEERITSNLVPFPEVIIGLTGNFKTKNVYEVQDLARDAYRDGEAIDANGTIWDEVGAVTLLTIANHLCNANLQENKWQDESNAQVSQSILSGSRGRNVLELDVKGNFDENHEKIISYLNAARGSCQSMIKACSWGGKKIDCADAFVEVQTDLGAGCSFNKIPFAALRQYESWQTKLTDEKPCQDDVDMWSSHFNIDKDIFSPRNRSQNCISSTRKYQQQIPLTQTSAGQQFGLSYLIQFDDESMTCLQINRGVGHYLEINSVMDDSNMLRNGLLLPHNHDIFITLEAVIVTSEWEIGYWFTPKHRNCTFTEEAKSQEILKYFVKYTEENCLKECVSDEIKRECQCGLIAQPNLPGLRICTTTKDLECAKRVQHANVPCPNCLPGCTDLKYRITEMSMVPYNSETAPDIVKQTVEPGKSSTRVSISFKRGSFTIMRRKMTYDWAELVALLGGTISLTNGFSFIDGGRLFDAVYQLAISCVQYFIAFWTIYCYGWTWWFRRRRRDDASIERTDSVEIESRPACPENSDENYDVMPFDDQDDDGVIVDLENDDHFEEVDLEEDDSITTQQENSASTIFPATATEENNPVMQSHRGILNSILALVERRPRPLNRSNSVPVVEVIEQTNRRPNFLNLVLFRRRGRRASSSNPSDDTDTATTTRVNQNENVPLTIDASATRFIPIRPCSVGPYSHRVAPYYPPPPYSAPDRLRPRPTPAALLPDPVPVSIDDEPSSRLNVVWDHLGSV